jgi:TrmH family RNA methyltransferase
LQDYARFAVHEPTLILDNLQDPGNMGTLIRTAVAFGRTQIVLVGGVYPESSKVIRASAGLIAKNKNF